MASRILIVDDDADLLKLLQIRLQANGYEISCASSGEEALARVAAVRPDLVITDLRMDGMDGMALFEALHQSCPGLPVIILTAHGSIPDAVAATRKGVFGYLTKPFDSKQLLAEVEQALASGRGGGVEVVGNVQRFGDVLTRNPALQEMLARAQLVASGDASVLISGESGTGKELLARAIHRAGKRGERPFVAINCGAIPENLLESELFGHVRGAFTGASRDKVGLFEAASGGTLFLDEIGDMPMSLQVKLLRVLQERMVRPLGAIKSLPVDVRVISATHRDLPQMIRQGEFREDLYYRLHVVNLRLPSLDSRREDIPLLAQHFLQQMAQKYGKQVNQFAPDAIEILVGMSWPGNIRQLENFVEQLVALSTTPVISAAIVQSLVFGEVSLPATSFEEARRNFERDYLVQLLKIAAGNVTQAARLAKRNRTDFYKLLERNQIDPAQFKSA